MPWVSARPVLPQLAPCVKAPQYLLCAPTITLATPRLAGKTLASAGLHQMPGAFLSAIDRDGKPLPAVTKDEVLREGDILWFAGG